MTTTRRAVLTAAGALALAGCDNAWWANGEDGGGAAPSGALRRGNAAEPGTLDPQKFSLTVESVILRDLFEGLMSLDAQARPIPGAAERMEISPDGLTYTFRLREGLVWSDGTANTAEDFAAGLRRAIDPKTAAQYANLIYFIKNARAANMGETPPETLGVSAPDERTVVVTLEHPTPLLEVLASYPMLFPVPRHVLARRGDDWVRPGNMVTNGAFTLAEWRPGDFVRATKNPRFHAAGQVTLGEVVYYPTEDESAALKRFRAGALDTQNRFPPNQLDFLRQNLPQAVRIAPFLSLSYIVPNTKAKPFDDPRVRRALSLAIDRTALTDRILRNGETPAFQLTTPLVEGYPQLPPPAGDRAAQLALARALLAEAGHPALSFRFNIRAGDLNRRAGVAVQAMWAEAGVTAEIVTTDVARHHNLLEEFDFTVADAGWSFNQADPYYTTYLVRTESVETNWGRWSNAAYDRLCAEGERTLDRAARFALFAQAEEIAMADAATIPLYFPVSRNLVQSWVAGFEDNGPDIHLSRWMSLRADPQRTA